MGMMRCSEDCNLLALGLLVCGADRLDSLLLFLCVTFPEGYIRCGLLDSFFFYSRIYGGFGSNWAGDLTPHTCMRTWECTI
jgi:hypothetical protein